MKLVTVITFSLILSSCQTFQKYTLKDTGYWKNATLAAGEIQLEFSKIKSICNVESYKLPIPSPSCVQPPRKSCAGMTGFALGLCQGYTPKMRCDYSSVNIAKQARSEIFSSCMQANGWQFYRNGIGGVFEYIAYNGNYKFFIKLGSVTKSGNMYSAIIRQKPKNSSGAIHQGMYVFNTDNNTFKVDSESYINIPKGSPAEFLLNRIKDYNL
ncbi:hypothetical protein SPBRAN_258 [uncultured Candidatus Thioglobus sp.]|nr:hypothetical protein SPBRAN_258 [uncultured Candidatus Thioglobus sp.]